MYTYNVINILRLLCSIHLYSPLLIFWKHCLIFWHKYVCTLITFGENTFCKQSLIYKYHLRYLTRPDIGTYIKFIISELWTPNLRHLTRPLHASSVTRNPHVIYIDFQSLCTQIVVSDDAVCINATILSLVNTELWTPYQNIDIILYNAKITCKFDHF